MKLPEPSQSTIDFVFWLVWRNHYRQATRGAPKDEIPFHFNAVRGAVSSGYASRGMVNGEYRYFVSPAAHREAIRWLYHGVDPLGNEVPAAWKGRLRRRWGVAPDEDLEFAISRMVR